MARNSEKTQTEHSDVGIVLVNWNNFTDTATCLTALEDLSYPSLHVIVVDNGSTDDSGERLAAAFDWCEFVFNDQNRGFGGGCNAGVERAIELGCEYVLLLNNDAIIEPGVLSELVTVAKESGAGIVGAMVRDQTGDPVTSNRNRYPDMLFYSGYRENLPFTPETRAELSERRWWETDRVEGAGVLLTREFLLARRESVGYYLDESLFMYCEEIEMAMWCRERGWKSVVAENATVVHDGGNSSNRAFQLYYLTRNRMLIANRYFSKSTYVAFTVLYLLTRLALAARKYRQGNRSVAKAIITGLVDGYRRIDRKGTSPT